MAGSAEYTNLVHEIKSATVFVFISEKYYFYVLSLAEPSHPTPQTKVKSN